MTSLDPSAVDARRARARRDVDEGLLPSRQLALALDGEVVMEAAFGDVTVDRPYTMAGWADLATELSFACLTNGRDPHLLREHRRTNALGSLSAVCAA